MTTSLHPDVQTAAADTGQRAAEDNSFGKHATNLVQLAAVLRELRMDDETISQEVAAKFSGYRHALADLVRSGGA